MDIQFRGNYEARQKTAQGVRKGIVFFDLSVAKRVLNERGNLVLNINDILNSRRDRFISEGTNFFTEGNIQSLRRQINLTLNYRIKQ
jgi:hypothetical protein